MRTILTKGLLLTLALLPMGCEEKVCFNAEIVNVPAGPWIGGKDLLTAWSGINNDDLAIGTVWDANFIASGVLYDMRDGTYEFLDLDAPILHVGGINDEGTMLVTVWEAMHEAPGVGTARGVAYLRTAQGESERLPSPNHGLGHTMALGLNDVGDAVGAFFDGATGRWRGVIWRDGEYEVYDAPDAVNTLVTDIADDGTLVGWYDEGEEGSYGFIDDGEFLPVVHDGRLWTRLEGINDAGAVAGWSADVFEWSWLDLGGDIDAVRAPPEGAPKAFLLHGERFDRVWVRGYTTTAMGVNDANVMVGQAGYNEGFLARPKECPER